FMDGKAQETQAWLKPTATIVASLRETGRKERLAASLPVPRHKSRLGSRQVRMALPRQHCSVNPHVVHKHVETLPQRVTANPAVAHVFLFRKRHAIGQAPGVALTRHSTELVGHG